MIFLNSTSFLTKCLLLFSILFSINSYASDIKSSSYSDETNSLNITQILNSKVNWKIQTTNLFSKNSQVHPIWVKINLNLYQSTDFLYIQSESLYICELYQVRDRGVIKRAHLGMNAFKHTDDIDISSKFIALDEGTDTLYIKLQAISALSASFHLLSKEEVLKSSEFKTLSDGLFFGILLFLLISNLVLYIYTRFKAYIPYLVYILGLLLYFLFIDTQYVHQLWPYDMVSLSPIFQFSMSLTYMGMFVFPLVLLNISTKYPKTYRLVFLILLTLGLMEVSLIYLLSIMNFELYNLVYTIETVIVIFLFFILLFVSLHLAIKGDKLAMYYFMAWSVLFVGLINYLVQYSFFVDNLSLAKNIFRLSVVVEGFLFSFILAYKMKELEKTKMEFDKNIVQKNYNKEMGTILNEVSHQWRQPLNSINAIIFEQIVQDKRPQKEEWIEILTEIENLTSYLSNTIEDFQYPYDASPLNENFSVEQSIENALQLVSRNLNEIKISSNIDSSILLHGSQNHFVQVLLIIINNSVNALNLIQGLKTISIKVSKELNTVIISIQDNADGMPQHIQETLGDPFVTSKAEGGNKGIGLYMAKKILENNFNASLEVSPLNTGTQCLIKLTHEH